MNIAIDANEANVKNRSYGVSQYAFNILSAIFANQKDKKNRLNFTLYLKNPPISDMPPQKSWWKYEILGDRSFWILSKLTKTLYLNKNIDLFFTPSHYLPPILNKNSICTIHDLGYLESSEQFKKKDYWQLKYWSAKSINLSNYIISVSKSTKDDIVRHYKIPEERIVVIPHGIDKTIHSPNISNTNVRRIMSKYNIQKEYLLYIGTMKPSKNIDGIIKSFDKYLQMKNPEKLQLVIAGAKGWMYEDIFNLVKDLNLEKKVIFTGFVDEEDKPTLIKGAKILLSPSYWEGFGMQVLEAFACATPVIVSKNGSLPEIAKDAGFYVDPDNHQQIALTIQKILSLDEQESKLLKNNLLKRAGNYSWEKSAQMTIDLFMKAKESKN